MAAPYTTRKITLPDFPPLLQEIPDKPQHLYLAGDLPPQGDYMYLSVVGSRKYTEYGKEACEKLIEGLHGYPIVIVSGLALGIDGIAHKASLQAGLKTIAVPGSGLDESVLYPSAHRNLVREIIKNDGALLSEFEPMFRATSYSFPQRNRIMAGLSHATLVIEAEKRSGTLITARLALEYNRDVLTIPGSIFSKTSEGPHYLLKNGAIPVRESTDILEALHIEEKSNTGKASDTEEICSSEELSILTLLNEPRSRDEIIRLSALPPSATNALISMLEIKGLVVESNGELRRI